MGKTTNVQQTMKMFKPVVLLGLALLGTLPVVAQQQRPRVSPSATVNAEIGGAKLKLVYSRPLSKDPKSGEVRKIWGKLVPYGKVWRTGANEATLLTTDKDLEIGGLAVPAGTYSLYTLPEESGDSKLIINKQTGQWGTVYDEKQDFGRVTLKKASLDKTVDQFTMDIRKGESNGGVLAMMWENTEYSVPFTVKK
jgi:hypothetical protein